MIVFSSDSKKGVVTWGPTASVSVRVEAIDDVINESWLLTDVRVGAREIVDVRQCFNDKAVIYALGNNQGQSVISLGFVIFIGRKFCKYGNNTVALKNGLGDYFENRISKKPTPTTITIGKFAGEAWLTGIEIGSVDADSGTCRGTLDFIMRIVA